MTSPPEPLSNLHDLAAFSSGEPTLDRWLAVRALGNEASGATRTYVLARNRRVLGFYALAAGSVAPAAVTGAVRRNMPDPIPAIVLGRLAVDRSVQGLGHGAGLVRDALLRCLKASEQVGVRAVLVHAKNPGLGSFYRALGFAASPADPDLHVVTIRDIRARTGRG